MTAFDSYVAYRLPYLESAFHVKPGQFRKVYIDLIVHEWAHMTTTGKVSKPMKEWWASLQFTDRMHLEEVPQPIRELP